MSWMKHSRRGTRPRPPRERENGLVIAISNGDRGWLTTLLQSGADANAPHRGTLPLHLAARRGEFDIVDLLIAHGGALDGRDDNGCTALMISAAEGDNVQLSALLTRGADPDAADKKGNTALHHAACGLHFDILWRLVVAGGNADAPNHAGDTVRGLCTAEGRHALDLLEQAEKERRQAEAKSACTLQKCVSVLKPPQIRMRRP